MTDIRVYVLRDYRSHSPEQQLIDCEEVMEEMAGNPEFPTPGVPLSEMASTNDTYRQKIMDAESGDSEKVRIRDEYEIVWETMMDNQADYVESVAKGNIEIILSSGYRASKTTFDKQGKPAQMVATGKGVANGSLAIYSETFTNSAGILGLAAIVSEGKNVEFELVGDHQLNIKLNGEILVSVLGLTKHRGKFTGLPRRTSANLYMVGFNAAGFGDISTQIADVTVP